MLLPSDPRASLHAEKSVTPPPTDLAGAEYAKFYETKPQEDNSNGKTWYARGQNFVIAYTEAAAGGVFERTNQPDEYVVLLPDADTGATIMAADGKKSMAGYSVAFVPPGNSTVVVPAGGRLIRMFTTRSHDLATRCSNAGSYAKAHPNIPPFEPWPAPPDGYRIRSYSLDVKVREGRFGRIFRCTTFMVNTLDPRVGPRDTAKLSPHHHDDFEQCSLALAGAYIHDIRWPWTPDMSKWRCDEHEHCASPSIAVIPPPAIHTSRAIDAGLNQLVDIFCPPRIDFSSKPGWVLNAEDYPLPENG